MIRLIGLMKYVMVEVNFWLAPMTGGRSPAVMQLL